MTDPRSTSAYQRARAACVANGRRLGLPCQLCGQPIRYDLPGTHTRGPSADHIGELALGGHVLGQLRVTHLGCNSRRGSLLAIALGVGAVGARRKDPGPSRDW